MFIWQKVLLGIWVVLPLLLTGCGSSSKTSKDTKNTTQLYEKNLRTATYITKGNFVQVAQFAYKKVTDPAFNRYAMPVILPGIEDEAVKMSAYDISAISKGNSLKKIKMANYQNSLEIKFIDKMVNIIFSSADFTVDRQMPLSAFVPKQ